MPGRHSKSTFGIQREFRCPLKQCIPLEKWEFSLNTEKIPFSPNTHKTLLDTTLDDIKSRVKDEFRKFVTGTGTYDASGSLIRKISTSFKTITYKYQ